MCSISAPVTEDDISWVKLSPTDADDFTETTCADTSDSSFTTNMMLLDTLTLEANGSVLQFSPVMFGDEGAYVCVVRRETEINCYSTATQVTGKF